MFNKQEFKFVRAMIPSTSVSSAGNVIHISNTNTSYISTGIGKYFEITINALTGNCYISTTATTPSSTNSLKLVEGESIDIQVESDLYILGDATTSVIQGVIWGSTTSK
jgi:hypothetical protein